MKKQTSVLLLGAALTLSASLASATINTPTVDGAGITSDTYTLVSLQTQSDGFGGSARALGLYMANDATNLYIAVTGNLSGNAYHIFLDTKSGGVTNVATDPTGGYNEFNDLATGGNGQMPAGFLADYVINAGEGGGNLFVGQWDLQANTAAFQGDAVGSAAIGWDNSGTATQANASAGSTGFEYSVPLATLGLSPHDVVSAFVIAGNKDKGGNPATYMANNTLPPIAGAPNYGNDGSGGAGGNGVNYNGTGGPAIRPVRYRVLEVNTEHVHHFAFNTKRSAADLTVAAGDFRGMDYNRATGNLLMSEDDNGQVIVLDPSNLTRLKTITGATTGDGTLKIYEMGVSDDGYIFTAGFAGTVKLVGTESVNDATTAPLVVVNAGYGAVTGSLRALDIVGEHANGQNAILSGRGGIISIFRNTPNAPGTYTAVASAQFDPTGDSTSLRGIWANESLSVIYTYAQGAGGTERWLGTPEVGYVEDTTFSSTFAAETHISVDESNDLYILGGGHGSGTYIRFGAVSLSDAIAGAPTVIEDNNNTNNASGPNAGAVTHVNGLYVYADNAITSSLEGAAIAVPEIEKVFVQNASGTAASGSIVSWDYVRVAAGVNDWSLLD